MPTLQELLASPYDPRNVNYQGSVVNRNSQLQDLQAASMQSRNLALQSILSQYNRPMTDTYASAGADSLAQQLREGRQSRLEGLAQRGLARSGAASLSDRNLRELYARGLLDVSLNANQAEQNRKLGLMQQLLGLGQADLSGQAALSDAALGGTQANFAQEQTALLKNLMTAHGAGIFASILAGGAAGAAGGAGAGSVLGTASGTGGGAAGTAAGGISGALGAYNLGNSAFGGGGGGGLPPQVDVAGASSYGGKPVSTNPYGFNVGSDYMRSQITQNPEFTALLYQNRY